MASDAPADAAAVNRMRLDARLLAREALRYTPAGLAVCQATLEHESEQAEAGGVRRVVLSMPARFAGPLAEDLAREALGTGLAVQGFLAHRRLGRDGRGQGAIVLHVTQYSRTN